jgi:biopolymer transport protein ExbD
LRLITFIFGCLLLLQTGCDKQPDGAARQTKNRPPLQAPSEIVKVKVNQSGEIFIGGKPATLDELKQEFAR